MDGVNKLSIRVENRIAYVGFLAIIFPLIIHFFVRPILKKI